MKKILWALMSLVLLFTSCSNEEEPDVNSQAPIGEAVNHFYGVKRSDAIQTKGVAQSTNLWHKDATIKVKFLNGSAQNKSEVEEYANEWAQHISVKFDFVESGDAEVRILFEDEEPVNNYVTWSYTGTDCKKVASQSLPTANFAFFEELSKEDRRGEALRLFGQILGLEFEYRHLDFDAKWNSKLANIKNYWEGNISDLSWDELSKYVFDPLTENKVIQTEKFDPLSIMIWAFPKNVSGSLDLRSPNYELSEMDIEFIKQRYPKEELGVIVTMITEDINQMTCHALTTTSEIIVDWGDGVKEKVGVVFEKKISHNYEKKGAYSIKFYGDDSSLKYLNVYGSLLTKLDISKCVELDILSCPQNKLTELDVSKNVRLSLLNCGSNMLTELDISQNQYLNSLWCGSNMLTELDLFQNQYLRILDCVSNMLTELDFFQNQYLRTLDCASNMLTELDFSQNDLAFLNCSDNRLTELDLSQKTGLNYLECSANDLVDLRLWGNMESLTILQCHSNSRLRYLDLSNCPRLASLDCSDSDLYNLDLSRNTNLYEINCAGNPFVKNKGSLISFANTLPLYTNSDWNLGRDRGNIYMGLSSIGDGFIKDICESKNWNVY